MKIQQSNYPRLYVRLLNNFNLHLTNICISNTISPSSRPSFAQHSPVYAPGPVRQNGGSGLTAAQIAAQYEPARNSQNQQQQQQQQEPQLSVSI